MFLTETLSVLVQAMKATFDNDFPVQEYRNLPIGIEYPEEAAHYPGIWVDFDLAGDLSIAGIGHREYIEQVIDGQDRWGEVTRWTFEGSATFTIVSLSALSRAKLLDEVIRIIGFGSLESGRGAFRSYIEQNDLIGMTMNYDTLAVRGMDASPGTPWGTDDVVYEVTVAAGVRGEFTSTPSGVLVPISAIKVYPIATGEPDPTTGPWPG